MIRQLEGTGYDGWYATHTDGAYRTVRTEDVTGDGLPDLISPTDSAWPNPVWGADDTPHWRVHPNTGDGFDKEWIEWRIPSADLPFPGSAGDWMRETSMDWDTLTIGGGWPALVTATDPESGDPLTDADGNPAWHVYRNTGAGFAVEPSPWRVPDPVFATFWSSGGAAAEGWTTVDLTGDGCLDLVLTSGLDIAHPTEPDAAWAWQVWPGE